MKNGSPVAKVFLRKDDKEAQEYFKSKCHQFISFHQFVNVTTGVKGESDIMIGGGGGMKTNAIDNLTRRRLRKIIKQNEDKLMAKHSNIIGIGIGKMSKRYMFRKPCIVMCCLDKSLVPFGEEDLPKSLEGYPVDIREDFVMLGYCMNCQSLHSGCSIGRPSNDSAGSVGFFVKSRYHQADSGFITAAHVALERNYFTGLYENEALLSQHLFPATCTHEIVHPSWQESKINNRIGHVAEAFCGNYGPEEKGIDAAFVKLQNPKLRESCELQMAEDDDLKPGITEVAKTGRTTGRTTGILNECRTVSIENPLCSGKFVVFKDCYLVSDDETNFFEEGDSGSAVFLNDNGVQPVKALGIAFAFCARNRETVVCDIREVVDALNVTLFQDQEPMDIS